MTEMTANSAAQAQIERHYRFNFIVNALDGATYWFGYSFIAPAIILPLYISHFTSSPLIIGLIPFLNTGGFLIPQLFTSNLVSRAPVKKFFPVNIGFFTERVPVFLFAPTAYFLADRQPGLALLTFFLLYVWYCCGAGLIIVGWQDMVAKIIPVEHRGRFFGITNFVGNTTGILGALAVTFVLKAYPFPMGYVFAFSAASVLILMSWIALSLTREPAVPSTRKPISQVEYLRTLPEVMRRDHNFQRYLLVQILYSLSGMAGGFLIVFAAARWNMPDALAGAFVIAMQVGQSAANLFFGFLADRKGHKLSLEISLLINFVTLVLAFLAGGPIWFYVIFFLRGAALAGSMISGISLPMEFCESEDRPTYIGLANTIPGVAAAIAPLLGGWMASTAGYPPMFAVSAVIAAASLVVLHFAVREPRHLKPVLVRGDVPGETI